MSNSKINRIAEVEALLEESYRIRVNDLKKSVQLSTHALEMSHELGDQNLEAQCLSKLSLFYMILGEYDRAKNTGKEALAIFKSLGDRRGIADVKYNIAGTYYKTDNYHLGLIYLIDCLEIYRDLGDYHNEARVQKSLGTIYEYFTDEKSAVLAYEGAIEAGKMAKDLNLISNALNPLSGIHLNRNEIDKADELIEEAIRMKKKTGDTRGLAFSLYGKAKVHVKRKEYKRAEEVFNESMKIHEEMGERLGLGMCYHKLGALFLLLGDMDRAEKELNVALSFAEDFNIVIIKFKCNYLLYELYKKRKDTDTSLKYLEKYLSEKEGVINTQTQKVIESYEAITKMEHLHKEAQLQREKAEIMRKKKVAEESSRVKQEFLSTMSHEIRTPLNAVITITSLLAEKYKSEDELIKSLKFSADNLLRIINDILDFNKLDAGKVVLDYESTKLSSILDSICATYSGLAKERGNVLKYTMDKALGNYYHIDQTKLSQILGNLISNSIKFTEEGVINLSCRLVSAQADGDLMEFSVEDNGMGIKNEFLSEIFESFSQPKSFITKKHGGSGLGLAIVKKLVQIHGGQIKVETNYGVGSRFYFEVFYKKATVVAATDHPKEDGLDGLKVLIAEDNMINAMVAKKLLLKWGLEVDHAKNGLEAVEKASVSPYSFILMDIHMPEMDGFDAAEKIRESEGPNLQTPIFALTADITAHQRSSHAHCFNAFLLKPIEIQKVYHTLIKHRPISA